MLRRIKLVVLVVPILITFAPFQTMPAAENDHGERMVLVELYASQGCNYCPMAEALLGAFADRDRGIVPIAFHVDYFNDPWKDVFSDSLYSRRQMTYSRLYSKPKNAQYGLYYTPMLMIDGEQAVNGRDAVAIETSIRRARARKPAVALDVALDLNGDGLSGTANITVTGRAGWVGKSRLLVCGVLREDGVITNVLSGENAGKALVARFPARQTKYGFIEFDGKSPITQRCSFAIDPTWDRQKLRLAVFVQDRCTGVVHQSTDLPWQTRQASPGQATSAASTTRRAS